MALCSAVAQDAFDVQWIRFKCSVEMLNQNILNCDRIEHFKWFYGTANCVWCPISCILLTKFKFSKINQKSIKSVDSNRFYAQKKWQTSHKHVVKFYYGHIFYVCIGVAFDVVERTGIPTKTALRLT